MADASETSPDVPARAKRGVLQRSRVASSSIDAAAQQLFWGPRQAYRHAPIRNAQRVSAAAMNSPAPISNARTTPPSTERTRRRRSAGFVSAASVCAAKSAIQMLFMDQANASSGCGRVWRTTSDRARAYNALRAGTCPLALPLWSAKHWPRRRHLPSQRRRREHILSARGVDASQIFRWQIFHECLASMCIPPHMNSRGTTNYPHKCDIKTDRQNDATH
jgi:hypothetical protein